MSELKARDASELKSFLSSELKAFGISAEEFEVTFKDTFNVRLEIDKVDVFGAVSGLFIKSIGGIITPVMFNSHLQQIMQGGFQRKSLLDSINGGALLTNTVPRSGVGPLDFTQAITGGTAAAYASHNQRPIFLISGGRIIWSFDTDFTFVRTLWPPLLDNASGPLTGSITLHAFPSTTTKIQAWAWHWDTSENPPMVAGGLVYRHYGRVIYEPL